MQLAVLHWQLIVGCILLGIYAVLFLSDTGKGISQGEFRPLLNHFIALVVGLAASLFVAVVGSRTGVMIIAWVLCGIVILTTIVRAAQVGSLRLGAFWAFFYISLLGLSIMLPVFESKVLFFASSTIVIGESIGIIAYQAMLRKSVHSVCSDLDDFFGKL